VGDGVIWVTSQVGGRCDDNMFESSKYYQCCKCTFKVINMINEIGVVG